MKPKIISLPFVLFLFCTIAKSQQTIPSDGEAFYKKAMSSINAKHIIWVKSTSVRAQNMDEAGIRKLVSGYGNQFNLNSMDVEALVALVMMQCAKDQEKDLKNMMEEMKKSNEQKQSMRSAIRSMEQSKNEMSRKRLDSFKLLTTTKVSTVAKPSTARVQTAPTVTKVNTSTVTKVSATEIKDVQDDMKAKLDSLNELSDERNLKMQMHMDRRSKAMETLSNIMKKISETQDSIIQNLK